MQLGKGLRHYFFRGMAVLLPTILTIWIILWGYNFIQSNISVHINRGLVWLTMKAQGLQWQNLNERTPLIEFWVDGIGSIAGFIIALFSVCVIGAVLASVVGKTLWRIIEKSIVRIPFLKQVYPFIKQITDFLFTREDNKSLFSSVVAVEYPGKGIWSIGMVTGTGLTKVVENVKKEFLTVLIPTSPTPFTGFVIMVPKEDSIELDMTIEDAFRFAVSGGVITPDNNLTKVNLENK